MACKEHHESHLGVMATSKPLGTMVKLNAMLQGMQGIDLLHQLLLFYDVSMHCVSAATQLIGMDRQCRHSNRKVSDLA